MVMEKMIILYKNHKCGIDDPNNLEKYRDDTSVYKILLKAAHSQGREI